ncbi:hypothetical protein AYI70_g2191 [Smittium culicis]|uniref:Uncharacterized protein n=1 Tax=Smittium culicis TaxID=133412 RepID=A0A1R1Y9Q4_9FUNG|nr:hypothetical protein AYI70_g2191 [Smittium culicis]
MYSERLTKAAWTSYHSQPVIRIDRYQFVFIFVHCTILVRRWFGIKGFNNFFLKSSTIDSGGIRFLVTRSVQLKYLGVLL